VWGEGCMVQGAWCSVQGVWCRVHVLECRCRLGPALTAREWWCMPSEMHSSSSPPLSSSPLLASAASGELGEETATPASSPHARDPAPSRARSPMENASHWTLRTACALVAVGVDAHEEEGETPTLGYLARMNL